MWGGTRAVAHRGLRSPLCAGVPANYLPCSPEPWLPLRLHSPLIQLLPEGLWPVIFLPPHCCHPRHPFPNKDLKVIPTIRQGQMTDRESDHEGQGLITSLFLFRIQNGKIPK